MIRVGLCVHYWLPEASFGRGKVVETGREKREQPGARTDEEGGG